MRTYSSDFFDYNYFKGGRIHVDRRFTFRFYTNLVKKFKKSGNLLEIGCSFGYLLKRFEKDFKTYGMDKSKDAIKHSKYICKKSKTFVGDATNLSIFQDNFFDAVISLHTLEHLTDPGKAITEVYRILKNDGVFIFATPNTSCLLKNLKKNEWHGYRDESHVSLLEPQKWIHLTEKQGFKVMKTFSDGFWDAPYIPRIPGVIQKPIFGFMTAIQFIFCLPFIPVRLGENLIVIVKK